MRIRSHSLLLCLLALVSTSSASAEKPWTEVRSPHFRVLTNGSTADARHVAHEFEQIRYVYSSQFPQFRLDSGSPLTIFAARDEQTAKMLEPALWKRKGIKPAGEFHHGWEKQYVMVRLDDTGLDSWQLVYHEYTHTIMHLNSHWLPLWLDEGLAELYAYTRFEQHKIYIGAPTARARYLRNTPIPIKTLIDVTQSSPYYHDEEKAEMFYAESWVLVHYLIFGPGMDHGTKLNQFFHLLEQGTDQTKAFQQVFGSFAAMDDKLDQYMASLAYHAAVLQDPPQIDEKAFTSSALTMAQTEAELAAFHLWSADPEDARPLTAKALTSDPNLGLAHEVNGFLLFADGKDTEAIAEFSQACTLDPTLYLSLFAKTMMSPIATSSAPADQAAFGDALMKVAGVNPRFAPAYVQLARLSLRQGDAKTAFGLARRAEELEPSRAGYHLLTGAILLRMGKDAEAADDAKYVAEHWSSTDHDEAVELWNAIPRAHRPAGVTLTEQIPKDTQTAIGVIQSSTCGDKSNPLTIVLVDDGKPQTFQIKPGGQYEFGFSDTAWWGEDHFSPCRHLEGMRAALRYRPATAPNVAGDIVEIDLRDDAPTQAGSKAAVQLAQKP